MRAIVTPDGILTLQSARFRAALGRGGVRPDKREGDGATPAGVLPVRRVLYRADRVAAPQCLVPVQPIMPSDGWCDDPAHPEYNYLVHLPIADTCPPRLPVAAGAEAFWRDDAVYDIIGVLGWNDAPVQPGMGSAIFLHVARPDFAPTEGCVALTRDDLQRVLSLGLTEIVTIGRLE